MSYLVLQSMVGNDFSHKPGDVVEWPDTAEAERMVTAEILREIIAERKAETATSTSRKQKETR